MINTITVCGAGTMGAGIAQVAAQAGFTTFLFDINDDVLAKAKAGIDKNLNTAIEKGKLSEDEKINILSRLKFESDLNNCKCDMAIEAIVERLDIKQKLFTQLAEINGNETILASNTSSLSITQIAAQVPYPGRVVGMHFFNPAHLMKLVEVISGAATDENMALATKAVAEKMGKTVVMAKDSPGFIVNRVARHFYVESLKIAEENVADISTIDNLLENAGFKMGPFKLMDLIGNDINYSVTESLFNAFHYDPKFRPSRIQQQKVMAGHLGKKTGKGFYDYFK
jgi:3-hydroxybutyryl-CoA dehydrogenase